MNTELKLTKHARTLSNEKIITRN